MEMQEIALALQQLKDITTRMNKILEGNGLPGLVQKVNHLENQRIIDRKDVDAITTIVRSIETKVGKMGDLSKSLENIIKQVESNDYAGLIKQVDKTTENLNAHLRETQELKTKRDKLTSAVNTAVLVYVAVGIIKLVLNALGIVLP